MAITDSSSRVGRLSGLFAATGSFWSSVFTQPEKAQALVLSSQFSGLWENWQATLRALALQWPQGKQVSYLDVPYVASSVFRANDLFYDSTIDYAATITENNAWYGTTDADSAWKYSWSNDVWYGLPFNSLIPWALQGMGQRLLLGADYFWSPAGYLLFRQDPRELFPLGVIPVIAGEWLKKTSPMAAAWRLPQSGQDQYSIEYFRISSTPGNYVLALAAAMDLAIIGETQKLVAVTRHYQEYTYTFTNQTLRVDYPHEPLVVGQTYAAQTIIGNGLQLYQGDASKQLWWRQVDWRGGLSLDPLLPHLPGLFVPDESRTAYSVSDDPPWVVSGNGRTHVRWEIVGDDATQLSWWSQVQFRETQKATYLNSLPSLGLAADFYRVPTKPDLQSHYQALNIPDGQMPTAETLNGLPQANRTTVNSLDLFFQAGAGQQCAVLVLDYRALKNLDAMNDFLSAEPLGSGGTPLIWAYGPDLSDDPFSFASMGAGDPVTFTASASMTWLWPTPPPNNLQTSVPAIPVIRSFLYQ